MGCVSPLSGFFSKKPGANGRPVVVFNRQEGDIGRPVDVPCGMCIGCRLEYARDWAVRCMHEASLHDENCFATLTYDDDHVPEDLSLSKPDCQKFLKRLRARNGDKRIRYFLSGEYGSDTIRPHYHLLLFGFDFRDKKRWSCREGYQTWVSEELEETWGRGLTEIGTVTFESAAYCARYMVQKFKGKPALVAAYYDGLEPEFALQSRRPGIGFEYYQKFGREIHEHDSVIVGGVEQKPPEYYDRLFRARSPDMYEFLKEERKEKAERLQEADCRGSSRNVAEQAIMEARVKLRGEKL